MKVLLVEPDAVTTDVLKRAFKKRGHTIRHASSGQAAVDSMTKTLPDVIVLEIQLGVHNGIEFLYEIRSYVDWQGIPVVVYSLNQAVRHAEFRAPFRQLGVKDMLYKPLVTVDELQRVVEANVAAVV